MTVLRYVGRARGVEVDAAGVYVQKDDTADFPDDIAQSLLRQRGQWEAAKPSKTTTKKDEEAD